MDTRQAKWNKNNPEKVKLFNMLGVVKRKCLKEGIKYDLDAQWLREKIDGVCEATAQPFELDGPFAPVIIRADEASGFTKENCQVVTQIYSVAGDASTLYKFCKQFILTYDILRENS